MRKLKLLAIIPVMCLSSCSKNDIYGIYEFRLGKTDGTHFGVSVELLKDEAKDDKHDHSGFKKMNLIADLGSEFDIDGMIGKYVQNIPYIEDFPIAVDFLSGVVKQMIPQDGKLPGFYKATEYTNSSYGTRYQIGTDYFSDFVMEEAEKLAEEAGIEITEEVKKYIVELQDTVASIVSPSNIQKVMCAYLNKTTFTLQVPVSLDDIKNELAWNGLFYKVTPESPLGLVPDTFDLTKISKLPGPNGEARYGVHPAVTTDDKGKVLTDEIKEMNDTYKYVFSNTYLLNDSEDEYLGTFVEEVENGSKVLYFSEKTGSDAKDFKGKIACSNPFIQTKEMKPIHFKVDNKGKVIVDYAVKPADDEDFEEGFTDLDGNEFTFKEIMVTPFTFRDYHDVKVGLQKAN